MGADEGHLEERGSECERVRQSSYSARTSTYRGDCSYLMPLREIESEHPQICLGGAIAAAPRRVAGAAAVAIIRNTQFDPIDPPFPKITRFTTHPK